MIKAIDADCTSASITLSKLEPLGKYCLSAISAYYYLRVVRYMYMLAPEKETTTGLAMSPGLTAALTLAMLMIIVIGVVPGWLLNLTGRSLLGFGY